MEAFADPVQARTPGRVLAAERERQGLGPADVAQRLHMSVSQVEALEADDYSRLPRGPFLRGFVRNYAKAVGLAPDEVLSLLAAGAPREAAPGIVVPSQNIQFGANGISNPYVRATVVAGVLVALGFAAMYWLVYVRNAPPAGAPRKPAEPIASAPVTPPPATAQAPAPQPATPAPQLATPSAPPAAPASLPAIEPPKSPAKVEVAKAEPPKSPANPEPSKAAPAKSPEPGLQRVATNGSGSTLKFRFKGKSWVEVKDAGGRVLLTGLNDAGSESVVTGKPPFRLIVGNAPDVNVSFNDRELDLGPHMREAVARLTVE